MNQRKSTQFFKTAKRVIPGGVNSPVRACRSVNMDPTFIDHANGCKIYDVDNNEYIDYVCSWGAMILGHRHPKVLNAIKLVLENGTSYGAPTTLETELAQLIVELVPSIDLVRMVNSGTEATMSAIRLARGYTGRDKIIKFDGCYHGHVDSLLVQSGSGIATLNIPGSPGIPESFVKHTISLPFNDIDAVNDVMKKCGDQVACVIVEPVAGNMGLVLAQNEFLKYLRSITEQNGTILIFDEVMTGFRVSLGGAQELFNLKPDLTCFGKIIGGGLPVGAYGGKREIMSKIAPEGPIYQAGTLSGNPLAMASGIATLKVLKKPGFYESLEIKSKKLFDGLKEAISKADLQISLARVGSMLGLYFNDNVVNNFNDAKKSNLNSFSAYYKIMLELGIYLAPSQFEALFISSAHDTLAINKTIQAAEVAFAKLA